MLTSWGKFFTVQGGAKRPSNVEITCDQSLLSPTFFPINVKSKGRSFNYQEFLGNRADVEVIRQASMGRLGRLYRFFFLPSKNNWNFLVPISWLGL